MVGIMILILFFSFRSFLTTMAPWLVIACGILLVLEIQSYLGIPHSTIDSGALAPTLIIIGIGITVHVLLEFFNLLQLGQDSISAARSTIINIWRPAFFTELCLPSWTRGGEEEPSCLKRRRRTSIVVVRS